MLGSRGNRSTSFVCVRTNASLTHPPEFVCTHTLGTSTNLCKTNRFHTRETICVAASHITYTCCFSLSLPHSIAFSISHFISVSLSQKHSLRCLPPSLLSLLPSPSPFMRQDSPALLHLIHSALIIQPHWSLVSVGERSSIILL